MNIESWLKECKEMSPKTAVMVLCGNKRDLLENRQVTTEEAEDFAKNNNLLFIETSALTGENVNELFFAAAKEVLSKVENGNFELKDESCGIKIGTYSKNSPKKLAQGKGSERNKKCCK